jgi:ADP-glucose pyrophosphorylase
LSRIEPVRPIDVILPGRELGPEGFRGTADAIYQDLHVIERCKPNVVAVFAADQVYRMDVRQMVEFHEARDADVTIAAVPGIQPYEDRGYWRNVGTIEAFQEAQRDVAGPRPRLQLSNRQWPIRGQRASSPGIRGGASGGPEVSGTSSA